MKLIQNFFPVASLVNFLWQTLAAHFFGLYKEEEDKFRKSSSASASCTWGNFLFKAVMWKSLKCRYTSPAEGFQQRLPQWEKEGDASPEGSPYNGCTAVKGKRKQQITNKPHRPSSHPLPLLSCVGYNDIPLMLPGKYIHRICLMKPWRRNLFQIYPLILMQL